MAWCLIAWENRRHFATPPLVSPRNDVWETSAEIPYWWRVYRVISISAVVSQASFRGETAGGVAKFRLFSLATCLTYFRAVASGGGGKAGSCPPRPVDPDTASLWMDLFSLDSVILIIVTCNCLPFSWFEVDFSETYPMTSAENSVSEPPNLEIFWRRIPPHPPTRLLPSALAIMFPPPSPPASGYKNLATALYYYKLFKSRGPFLPSPRVSV